MFTGHAPGSLAETKRGKQVRCFRLNIKLKNKGKISGPHRNGAKLDTFKVNISNCQVNSGNYSI